MSTKTAKATVNCRLCHSARRMCAFEVKLCEAMAIQLSAYVHTFVQFTAINAAMECRHCCVYPVALCCGAYFCTLLHTNISLYIYVSFYSCKHERERGFSVHRSCCSPFMRLLFFFLVFCSLATNRLVALLVLFALRHFNFHIFYSINNVKLQRYGSVMNALYPPASGVLSRLLLMLYSKYSNFLLCCSQLST